MLKTRPVVLVARAMVLPSDPQNRVNRHCNHREAREDESGSYTVCSVLRMMSS